MYNSILLFSPGSQELSGRDIEIIQRNIVLFPPYHPLPLQKNTRVKVVMLFLRFNIGHEHPSSEKIWTTDVTKWFSALQFLLWQNASKWWHWVGMVLLALAFFQTWLPAGYLVSLLRTKQLGRYILLHSNSSKKDEGTLPIFLPSQILSCILNQRFKSNSYAAKPEKSWTSNSGT